MKKCNVLYLSQEVKETSHIIRITFSLICILFYFTSKSQLNNQVEILQTLRGKVIDQSLQKPLSNSTVILPKLGKSIITDEEGNFSFSQIPIGIYSIMVTHIGYKAVLLDNIYNNSGKQTVLTIPMETTVKYNDTITIRAASKLHKPLNDMSQVSSRAFTVEETQKYAAAVNDPLRMAVSFPGIQTLNDSKNSIIIRGNSPGGLLWRMEGVDIPNPNHFSNIGSNGGSISILSAQLLNNSDFLTGAFPADYGNALSGVFDLQLRKGNNEKREYTVQAGLLGLDVSAEGPFKSSYGGSYLIDYRYSTLAIINKLGIPIYSGSSNFQDLSYNIYLPTEKAGDFTLFGFNGLSSNETKPIIDSAAWIFPNTRNGSAFISNTIANGITHRIYLDDKTTLKSAFSFSLSDLQNIQKYVENNYSLSEINKDVYRTIKETITSTLDHKFSPGTTLRSGFIYNIIGFNFYKKESQAINGSSTELINSNGSTQSFQAFTEMQLKPSNKLTFVAGIHFLNFLYNNSYSLEPRGSFKWNIDKRNSLAIGYGLHSQLQPLGVYFAESHFGQNEISYPNKNLDLTKAHHFVISWQHSIKENLKLRTEIYYQNLFNVPVSVRDSSFSLLNIDENYITDPLVNKGKGRNYGIEVSMEKYLSNYFYYLFNISFYQSKYSALDGKERNTRFNGNYLSNFTVGKEFLSLDKAQSFGINLKVIYSGGLRTTPIDIEKSKQLGYTYFIQDQAYSIQNPAYFRADLRLSKKWNRKKRTNTLSLDIQNVTNRLNILDQVFIPTAGMIFYNHQNGLIPDLNYKVEF